LSANREWLSAFGRGEVKARAFFRRLSPIARLLKVPPRLNHGRHFSTVAFSPAP
jgi:hypothetical protein